MGRRQARRYFGSTRVLPSGRVQARYTGPDGRTYTGRTPRAAAHVRSERYANAYLVPCPRRHTGGPVGVPRRAPARPPGRVRGCTRPTWLAGRDLADRTREDYAAVLRDHICPRSGSVPVTVITPAAVRAWHAGLRTDGADERAHAYGLLRTIMTTAVADEVIPANPCRVRGGGQVRRAKTIRPASLARTGGDRGALPGRYRLMALLAAWCALRSANWPNCAAPTSTSRRRDPRPPRRGGRVSGGRKVKGPKSEAGKRDVAIPPHLIPAVKDHLRDHVAASRDALVFPAASGGHMAPASLYRVYYPAREAAGRPDLRFHDLRHTGAALAAATGATLAELMARLGHSTAGAALRYQHAAAERDRSSPRHCQNSRAGR